MTERFKARNDKIRALRKTGMTLWALADRFGFVSVSTVYLICNPVAAEKNRQYCRNYKRRQRKPKYTPPERTAARIDAFVNGVTIADELIATDQAFALTERERMERGMTGWRRHG